MRVTEHAATRTRVFWWDSAAELAGAAERRGLQFEARVFGNAAWAGGTWGDAVRDAARGRTDMVAEAERLVEDVMSRVESARTEWAPSVAGAYSCVPDAVVGHPASMRRRVEAEDDRSPLRVVVDLTSSVGVAAEDLRRRGTAYLALAMALSAERPVELWAAAGAGNGPAAVLNLVRVPSQPLDLSVACAALCSTAFTRLVSYAWAFAEVGAVGKWAWGYAPVGGERRAEYVRRVLEAVGAGRDDVYAPPTWRDDPAVKDPAGFVRRAVEEHNGRRGQ